jgi:hypothetical protein
VCTSNAEVSIIGPTTLAVRSAATHHDGRPPSIVKRIRQNGHVHDCLKQERESIRPPNTVKTEHVHVYTAHALA